MKIYLFVGLVLLSQSSIADFFDAQNHFDNKEYKEAIHEFHTLSKLGNEKAQFNYAVMLAKGLGTEVNLIKAYGWGKLANESGYPKYKELTETIKKSFNQEQLVEAEKLYEEFKSSFGYENVKLKLAPTVVESNGIKLGPDKNILNGINIKAIATLAPNYPRNAAIRGIQGWVVIEFDVYPDGTVRNINPIKSFPNDIFVHEASKAIALYRFEFEKDGEKVIPEAPRKAIQQIDFRLANSKTKPREEKSNAPYSINPLFDEEKVKTFVDQALSGDIIAQYTIAINYDNFFSFRNPFDQKLINQWLLNAAIDGVPEAQYILGKNIYYGKGCKLEKQKGLDWISHAAQFGNKDAEYMTYSLLESDQLINNTEKDAFYWLQQSAENGSVIAKLKYVKHISKLDNPTKDQIKTGKKYLKQYSSAVSENIDWLHTKGLFDAKIGKIRNAKKSLRKAIYLAKKIKWDTSEIEKDLESI